MAYLKRKRGSIDLTNQSTIKRSRFAHQQQHLTLNTFPYKHQYTVPPHLNPAIPKLEEDAWFLLPYYDLSFSYSPLQMERETMNGRRFSNNPRMTSPGEVVEALDDLGTHVQEKAGQQWENEADSASESSRMPVIPYQGPSDGTSGLAENIMGFLSRCCNADYTPPSHGNGYETGSMLSPSSTVGVRPNPNYPNYGTSMTGLPRSYDNSGPNGMPPMSDDSFSSQFFCDTSEFNNSSWMPRNQVQTQPSKQEMTYPQLTNGYTDFNSIHVPERGGPQPIPSEFGFVSDRSSSCQRKSETENNSGSVQGLEGGEPLVTTGPTRRGPFKNLEDRAQTAQTRRDGGCLRCKYQKIRCEPDPSDPKGVCLKCKNVKAASMKVQKPICTRYKVTDIRLYKIGQVPGLEWSQRWSNRSLREMTTWASKETVTIEVSEGYTATPLKLVVCKFNPIKGDVLERSWVPYGGVKKTAQIPSFAIKDLSAAREAYEQYINGYGAEFFKGALDPKDGFLWMTYSMAIAASNLKSTPEPEGRLLKTVLRLWVAIRLNTTSTNIVGPETLGMPRNILDKTHPTPGKIPIPPVMGNQIELILSRDIQDPLRADILDKLQKMIYSNKASCWFTIYLCTFILLHNCAMITRHDASYARKHGIQAPFARPKMVAEYHTGATALLAHFHFCNKGSYPFSAEGEKADVLAAAGLTEAQMKFIQRTRNFVNSNAERFRYLKRMEKYENDYYFIAQLYEQDWKPRVNI